MAEFYFGKKSMDHSGHSSTSGSRRRLHNNNHDKLKNNRLDWDDCTTLSGSSSHSTSSTASAASADSSSSGYLHSYKKPNMPGKHLYVAMDCEMVGIADGTSVCARVVLTDWKGRAVLDTFVRPTQPVTDYRTFVSGVRPEDLVDAPSFEVVQEMVRTYLEDKIVVGHGLENDLNCLGLTHPWWMMRDTAYYQPFMKLRDGNYMPRRLKDLCQDKLRREIQSGGEAHDPTIDARTALDLYKSHRPRWEACVATQLSQIKQQERALEQQQQQIMFQLQLQQEQQQLEEEQPLYQPQHQQPQHQQPHQPQPHQQPQYVYGYQHYPPSAAASYPRVVSALYSL